MHIPGARLQPDPPPLDPAYRVPELLFAARELQELTESSRSPGGGQWPTPAATRAHPEVSLHELALQLALLRDHVLPLAHERIQPPAQSIALRRRIGAPTQLAIIEDADHGLAPVKRSTRTAEELGSEALSAIERYLRRTIGA